MSVRWGRWLVVLAVLTMAGLAAGWAVRRLSSETGLLATTGVVEAIQLEVSANMTARIAELRAREGQPVERGQVLVVLDAGDLVAEVSRAESGLRAAEAQLRDLEAGTRPEDIREAEARAARAQARLDDLLAGPRGEEIEQARALHHKSSVNREWNQRELARAREFLAKEIIAPQEVEHARQVYDSAAASEVVARERLVRLEAGPREHELAAARAELRTARERVQLLQAGARPREIEAARARVAERRAALELARARRGAAQLVSPITGIVLRKNAEAGETIRPGVSVFTLMDPQDLWVRVYIPETDIGRVKLGQKAAVSANAFPGRVFAGQVSEIASETPLPPKNVHTSKERLDPVVRVKIVILNPDGVLKPGLPVDVVIRP